MSSVSQYTIWVVTKETRTDFFCCRGCDSGSFGSHVTCEWDIKSCHLWNIWMRKWNRRTSWQWLMCVFLKGNDVEEVLGWHTPAHSDVDSGKCCRCRRAAAEGFSLTLLRTPKTSDSRILFLYLGKPYNGTVPYFRRWVREIKQTGNTRYAAETFVAHSSF